MDPRIEATLRTLVLFDVADAIRVEMASKVVGAQTGAEMRAFPRAAPEYVRFERPPLIEHCSQGRIKYYEYGVISFEADIPFEGTWLELADRTARWIAEPAENRAAAVIRERVERLNNALDNPYKQWITEDYSIILVNALAVPASDLLATHGMQIAQIVRGESLPLSDDERDDVLKARISYYPNDLAVIGWSAALVCDTPQSANIVAQLLEYANTQLLEYRHYDEMLTRVLAEVYKQLDEGTGLFARWRMAARAAELNAIRLDVIELAERADNAIKFLSDMFYARLYKMAAARVGVPDYRGLVDEKLRAAGELYQFMMDRFQQGRSFALELMVVVILLIELTFLFRGK